jgi:hypothetical protein
MDGLARLIRLYRPNTSMCNQSVRPGKLNVSKSKFNDAAPKSGTRVYAESADGKAHPITGNPDADSGTGKAINSHTSDFTLTKGGKVVGSVHRVVSADGKTLTVNNKGTHPDGKAYDETLIFDKQ